MSCGCALELNASLSYLLHSLFCKPSDLSNYVLLYCQSVSDSGFILVSDKSMISLLLIIFISVVTEANVS